MLLDIRLFLSEFFRINDVIVHFVHGQVFLILGVAIWMQWRQRSQLELSRALPWLAAFGFLEALATWGNGFIPIQTQLLDAATIEVLRVFQLVVHLLTFTALLGFGLKLNETVVPERAVVILPILVLVVGLLFLFFEITQQDLLLETRNAIFETVIRYFVCIPASLLVADGLRQQAARLLDPLHLQRIFNSLRIAGFAFLFYAVGEGIFAPAVVGFPSTWLNDKLPYQLIGVPIGVFRALTGLVILWFFFRALDVFRIEAERLNQDLERQQSLVEERERISRDLHDGTIQSIYAVGLLLEGVNAMIKNAGDQAKATAPDASRILDNARTQIGSILTMINRTIQDVRSYIYDLRSSSAEEDLARGLIEIVSEFRLRTGLPTEWRSDGNPEWILPPDRRLHVYQIMREALSNIVRHAHATQVNVELVYGNVIQLTISDNGIGKLPQRGVFGRGLNNMHERARLLKSEFAINATPGAGTQIVLKIWQN
ncbi:MAG: sensor histidine kinase [Anaerolineae bacterium]|nr:sensor histidine kinase [Anaerolineae bacterium]